MMASKWSKPDDGWYELNVDASFVKEEGKGAWGAILRDNNGCTIMSAWGIMPRCNDHLQAEAIAILEGLKSIILFCDLPFWLKATMQL